MPIFLTIARGMIVLPDVISQALSSVSQKLSLTSFLRSPNSYFFHRRPRYLILCDRPYLFPSSPRTRPLYNIPSWAIRAASSPLFNGIVRRPLPRTVPINTTTATTATSWFRPRRARNDVPRFLRKVRTAERARQLEILYGPSTLRQ